MRYGFMQGAMWIVFHNSFKEAVKTVLDENDVDGVMKRAKKKYREILADIDEFDKGSRFLTNILSCAMLSAVLLCVEKRYDVEIVRIYYKKYTAIFYTCGICTLMNSLGLSEYIPAMCAFDYDMSAMNNTKFTREFTLAAGGPYCDCHYDHSK